MKILIFATTLLATSVNIIIKMKCNPNAIYRYQRKKPWWIFSRLFSSIWMCKLIIIPPNKQQNSAIANIYCPFVNGSLCYLDDRSLVFNPQIKIMKIMNIYLKINSKIFQLKFNSYKAHLLINKLNRMLFSGCFYVSHKSVRQFEKYSLFIMLIYRQAIPLILLAKSKKIGTYSLICILNRGKVLSTNCLC